uniref:Uncharacterized protein n=1 Tax=viral metagenome TaxID=1070528 RepID=A0A6M3JKE8_9ZZZZ
MDAITHRASRAPAGIVREGRIGGCIATIATIATQGGTMEDASKVTGYYLRVWHGTDSKKADLDTQRGIVLAMRRQILQYVDNVARVEIAEVRDG